MDALEQRMKDAGIDESDLDESFVLGSGSGGQKVNKTASCVQLKHIPTGYEVNCQDTRSRTKNREIARSRMCEIFEEIAKQKKQRSARERSRKRYKRSKPSRAAKARMRKQKQMRAEKKKNRQKPSI